MYAPIDTEAASTLVRGVLAHRERPPGTPTADTTALLSLFPGVRLRDGFVLDYVQESTSSGVRLPAWPFARPGDDDAWLPLFDGEPGREDLVEQLYQYLEHEATPQALFEYVLFVLELWTPRTSGHDVDWLDSTPVVDEATFDAFLQGATKVTDLARPEHFAPLVELDDDGGGGVRFLVHSATGRQRIYYLEATVAADGFVDQNAGEIVADMGAGLVF